MAVCTPADVREVVENGVSARLDLDDNSAALLAHIEAAEEEAKLYLGGQELETTRETIYVDGSGTHVLVIPPKYLPIVEIHSIKYSDDSSSTVSDWIVEEDAGFVIFRGADASKASKWPRGKRNIIIDLTHGHNSSARIVRAVTLLAAVRVLLDDALMRDHGIQTRRFGDRSEALGAHRHAALIERWRHEAYSLLPRVGV